MSVYFIIKGKSLTFQFLWSCCGQNFAEIALKTTLLILTQEIQ